MPTPKWPESDVEKLKALWAKGMSAYQAAQRFDGKYTRSGIIGKVHRLDLEKRDTNGRPRTHTKPRTVKLHIPGPSLKKDAATDMGHPDNEPAPIGPLNDFPGTGACRWIGGDIRDGDWQCCGYPVQTNSALCEHHHARAHQPQTGKSSVSKAMISKSGILRAFGG